jgi:hypothetical protein
MNFTNNVREGFCPLVAEVLPIQDEIGAPLPLLVAAWA